MRASGVGISALGLWAPLPPKEEARENCACELPVKFGITKLRFSPSQTGYPGFDRSGFPQGGLDITSGAEQRQNGVAADTVGACLRAATLILNSHSYFSLTHLPLLTPNPQPPNFIFSFTFIQPNHIIHFIISISIIFKLQISHYDLLSSLHTYKI